jgi:hypothetical protein
VHASQIIKECAYGYTAFSSKSAYAIAAGGQPRVVESQTADKERRKLDIQRVEGIPVYGFRKKLGCHDLKPASQKRAGLGVWSCNRASTERDKMLAWKANAPFSQAGLKRFSASLAKLIEEWSPILPPGTVVAVPPQGASAPGVYAAEILGRRVAKSLGIPFVMALRRTDAKKWHGPRFALAQAPFVCDPLPEGCPLVIVIDDFLTTGTTMRLSIAAIRERGVCAIGFGYSGV